MLNFSKFLVINSIRFLLFCEDSNRNISGFNKFQLRGKAAYVKYLQCTMSMIRLLTVGGTPFDAMHKYAPMCSLLTRVMLNTEPSTVATETRTALVLGVSLLYSVKFLIGRNYYRIMQISLSIFKAKFPGEKSYMQNCILVSYIYGN